VTVQREQGVVFGEQPVGSGAGSKFQKLLVIRIGAAGQSREAMDLNRTCQSTALRQAARPIRTVQRPFLQRVFEYADEFALACSIYDDFGLSCGHGGLHRCKTGIVKYQPVEPYIGIENQSQRHAGQAVLVPAALTDFQVDVA